MRVKRIYDDYKERCEDCISLFAEEDGKWRCGSSDGTACKEVEHCPEGLDDIMSVKEFVEQHKNR